jgi:hypothetical protein
MANIDDYEQTRIFCQKKILHALRVHAYNVNEETTSFLMLQGLESEPGISWFSFIFSPIYHWVTASEVQLM